MRNFVFSMPVPRCDERHRLQQLQKGTNSSDTESQFEHRRGTAQSLFAIFEHHTICYVDETRGHAGHAAGPNEERDEKLSDMTVAMNLLVTILHLYSAIRLQCFLILRSYECFACWLGAAETMGVNVGIDDGDSERVSNLRLSNHDTLRICRA